MGKCPTKIQQRAITYVVAKLFILDSFGSSTTLAKTNWELQHVGTASPSLGNRSPPPPPLPMLLEFFLLLSYSDNVDSKILHFVVFR